MIGSLIPQSMIQLGSGLLLVAAPIQFFMSHRSKVALFFALLGGFGVGGGIGGWFGQFLHSSTNSIYSTTERLTAQAVGAGFGALLFIIIGIFFWKFAGRSGSGLDSKGKSKKTVHIKHGLWLIAFMTLGTAIAAIPGLYSVADYAVHLGGHAAATALPF